MLHDMQLKSEEQRYKIINLGQVIDSQEQDLLHMRKNHDTSIQRRNERWASPMSGTNNTIITILLIMSSA